MATQPNDVPDPSPPGQPTPVPTELPPEMPNVDVPDPGTGPMPTGPANPN